MAKGGFRKGAGRPRTVFGETYAKRYYHKHKESIKSKRKFLLEYARAYAKKCKYGIIKEEYDRLLVAQNSVCAICKEPETMAQRGNVQSLSVDHCHETKKVRGLICNNCNIMLGRARDRVDVLLAAAEYLRCQSWQR